MAHIPKSKPVQAEVSAADQVQQSDEPTASTAVHIAAQRVNAQLAGQPDPWPSQSDIDFRNQVALAAFREIISWQVAERKAGQEDVAASWAFRYADRFLDQSKKKPSLPSYNARGIAGIAEAPTVPEPVAPPADLAPLVEVP